MLDVNSVTLFCDERRKFESLEKKYNVITKKLFSFDLVLVHFLIQLYTVDMATYESFSFSKDIFFNIWRYIYIYIYIHLNCQKFPRSSLLKSMTDEKDIKYQSSQFLLILQLQINSK